MLDRKAAVWLAVTATAAVIGGRPLAAAVDGPDRPQCTSHNTGELYPSAANTDRELAQKLLRCGHLEICSRKGVMKYRWEHLSVTLEQLAARKNKEVVETDSCLSK